MLPMSLVVHLWAHEVDYMTQLAKDELRGKGIYQI